MDILGEQFQRLFDYSTIQIRSYYYLYNCLSHLVKRLLDCGNFDVKNVALVELWSKLIQTMKMMAILRSYCLIWRLTGLKKSMDSDFYYFLFRWTYKSYNNLRYLYYLHLRYTLC